MNINRIRGVVKLLRVNWLKSIYFNFHFFRFGEAVKMPVLLFGASFGPLTGKVILHGKVRFGMVQLGYDQIPLFHKGNSISIDIGNNAVVEFTDKCIIGSQSAFTVGGNLIFGSYFSATKGLNIVCWEHISFGKNCLVGWNNLFMDTSQHSLKSIVDNVKVGKRTKPIHIGDNCWITTNCVFLPGSALPNKSVVSTNSVVKTDFSSEDEGIVFAGNLASPQKRGLWLDRNDCNF